ncbi:calcium-binding protein [Citreicella sp. C3M06]|uniref:calcium-binding protein n=1 Tax=Citreicella sp. C3M06 TaxID=2841564 RepID=UPI001C0A0A7D|nr:calcium-binding protein [Citreicella sp. C3M06]MBU2963214.1 calcium-binding protein [Citreicella sp. C3M06]
MATQGNDTLFGTAGDDTINGLGGDDRIEDFEGGNDSFIGGDGRDTLRGGDGNDTLRGGADEDNLRGGTGNDLLDASGGSAQSHDYGDWIEPGLGQDTILGHAGAFATDNNGIDLSYEGLTGTGGLVLTVGNNGSGTAVSNIPGLINDTFTYAVRFRGTMDNDLMTGSGNNRWEGWEGSIGFDTLHGNGGYDELLYHQEYHAGGTGAVTVNFATGMATDSFGDTDSFSGMEAVRGTALGDHFTGSASQEYISYRGLDGADTIIGSDSYDRADYSNDGNYGGTAGIRANLGAGTIVDGFGMTDRVSLIDEVYGTDANDSISAGSYGSDVRFRGEDGNDTVRGGAGDDRLEGGDGNDRIIGNNGNDRLHGDDGNDTLIGGNGRDNLRGGAGNDRLDASGGNAASQEGGDYIEPGLGSDTILGHAGLWATGEGNDLSWRDVGGVGGLVISVGANGTGTAVSGVAGAVNDSFSYFHLFFGSQDDDLFNGSDEDRWEAWGGFAGNDTIHGNGGYDELLYDDEFDDGGTAGVVVNFATGIATDAFGGTDTFTGIEAVRATAEADRLIGSASINFISYRAMEGADTITGSSSWDRADYNRDASSGGNAGINADLGAGTIVDGFGDTDVVSQVEEVRGTDYGDRIVAGSFGSWVWLDGEGGDDTMGGGAFDDTLRAGDGDDRAWGNGGADSLMGNDGSDTLFGDAGNDVLEGDAGNDHLEGGTQNDSLYGGDGNDTVRGDNGADRAWLGVGNDVYTDTAQAGANGADSVWGGAGADNIHGGGGADLLRGELGNDTLIGGSGEDTLRGGAHRDLLEGNAQGDRLFGEGGNDTIRGEGGNDSAWGGAGADTLNGGAGDDLMRGQGGNDSLIGGSGADALYGDVGADTIRGGNGTDSAWLGAGNDLYTDTGQGGSFGRDSVWGGSGNDTINGGGGADDLRGQAGADRLIGGGGDDTLHGGEGADVFVFIGGGADMIGDFALAFDAIELHAGTSDTDDLTFTDEDGGALLAWAGGSVLVVGLTATELASATVELL